ncbi:MAG: hypothetical protein SWH54_16485 [Thermodesulfobacteriota bacterium]|nr:hypothetical protein [Thermodesulfobacteriota bacterium]
MKKLIFVFVLLLISMMGLTGCGDDGDDGNSYVAIDWVYAPISYWDDNPGIPSVFYRGEYYLTQAGIYNFDYVAWDGSGYIGTYTITVDEGEDGSLFSDGDDGDDLYFTIWLLSSGPVLNRASLMLGEETEKVLNAGLDESDNTDTLSRSEMLDDAEIDSVDSDVIVIEKQQGRYTMTLEYQEIP